MVADEGGRHPHVVADIRPFDLDYVGTLIREQHRAIGAGKVGGEVEDLDMRQRHFHWYSPYQYRRCLAPGGKSLIISSK